MKLHRNAALSLKKRELLVSRVVDENWALTEAAAAAEVSERTAGKWVRRFIAEGAAGLLDRSSAPKHVHNRTDERRLQVIAALRRLRMTGSEIAEVLRMPETTVSGLLKKIGMGRLGRLGLEPAGRYERKRPGELVHVDVEKLGRIAAGAGKRARQSSRKHYTPRLTDLPAFAAARPAGNTSTSASTTRREWPTSRSLTTRRRRLRSASLAAPFASSAATASRSSA
jgi:transposase